MKKRIEYIDIAKGIGIILTVIGHTESIFDSFIYQFHMPLFFFLSGIMFSEKSTQDIKGYVYKKFKTIYITFIKYEISFLLIHNFLVKFNFYTDLSNTNLYYSSKDFIENLLKIFTMGGGEQLVGPLWFLISLLEINIIFCILICAIKKVGLGKKTLVILLTMFYYIGCNTDLPRMLSASFIGMFFYGIGYMFKLYEDKVRINIKYSLLCILVVLICSLINEVDISSNTIRFKTMLIVSGLCGTYFIIWFSKSKILKKVNIIRYIGENSIIVLAFHCISFKLVMILEILIYRTSISNLGLFPVYKESQIWTLWLTLSGVLIPIIFKYIISSILKMKKIKLFYKEKLTS